MMQSRFEVVYDDNNAVCPYCKSSWQVESEDYLPDGEKRKVECDDCGKRFYLSQSYSIDHHSSPDCELNGEPHRWVPIKIRGYETHDFCSVCDKCRPFLDLS